MTAKKTNINPALPSEILLNPFLTNGEDDITFASIIDRIYPKLGRWIQKLRHPDPVNTYKLDQKEECERVSVKWLLMLVTVKFGIDFEWIEEGLVDGSPRQNTILNVNHEIEDGEDGAALRRRRTSAQNQHAVSAAEDSHLLQFPSNLIGQQKHLAEIFHIYPLPEMENEDSEVERICMTCNQEIWNRGWICRDALFGKDGKGDPLNPPHLTNATNHVCCSCFASGFICHQKHQMFMVQKFSMKEIFERYNDGIEIFNTILQPLLDKNFRKELKKMIYDLPFDENLFVLNDYEKNDPRPPKRSPTTVTYHLNLRFLNHFPEIYCHQCKSKRPSWEIVTCSDPIHIEAMTKGSVVKTKSGFFYCIRCLANRYQQRAIDAYSERNWECYVCRKECDCAACRPIFKPNHPHHTNTTATASPNNASKKKRKTAVFAPTDDSKAKKKKTTPEEKEENHENVEVDPSPSKKARKSSRKQNVKKYQEETDDETEEIEQYEHEEPADSHEEEAQPEIDENFTPKVQITQTSDNILSDVSIGQFLLTLQTNYSKQLEENRKLSIQCQKLEDVIKTKSSKESNLNENEVSADQVVNHPIYNQLLTEVLQLRLENQNLLNRVNSLSKRSKELEYLHLQANRLVIPNLRKLSRAIGIQAERLSQSLPISPDDDLIGLSAQLKSQIDKEIVDDVKEKPAEETHSKHIDLSADSHPDKENVFSIQE